MSKHFKHDLRDRPQDDARAFDRKSRSVEVPPAVQMGVIKAYYADKGFGFIFPADRRLADIFFHARETAPSDIPYLGRGRQVAFVMAERNGTPRAISVRLI